MDFEYDPDKSSRNLVKHGVDFEQAQVLWDDPDFIEVRLAYTDEPRWAIVGMMRGKHWTAIITYRKDRTRIISVRRSHPKEERIYENEKSG
ncbi:BrnT family toxin [Bifidobacterium sp. ESL0764]|uniref:BrnT family toxin n=1 Tax=Bifidobacterium sp. ESL0764 TaxID=2983228 RepID=UPI0023F77D0A|nr:BrnT family toxin [Bifidobacterium sp. ESL0764]WEV66148.1 BrnT family toxin [Bifidobacterium sp. ESL0764]